MITRHPTRIAYLTEYYPPEIGAGSSRAYELSRRWTEKGANGRLYVEKYFDRNHLADQYLDLIESIVAM